MPEVGIVIPAHASALGKAILAYGEAKADGEFRSMTGETITTPDLLREHLQRVRETRVAEEVDEAVIGESSLASPVFDSYGDVVGAIGIVLPTGGDLTEHPGRALVRETARAISRELGAATWPPVAPPG